MEMYVWKVRVEREFITNWEENGGKQSEEWTETVEYVVAAEFGFGAIEKAKQLAKDIEPWEDNEEEGEPVRTTTFNRIVDVVFLELKESLDG